VLISESEIGLCLRGSGKRARRHRSAPGAQIVRHSPRAGGDQAGRLPQRAPRGLADWLRWCATRCWADPFSGAVYVFRARVKLIY
jgi:hypothetical protein